MWWTGAGLGFDTETDGPVPTEARIITGAMVLVTPGNPPNPMELMLQPERDIDPEAIAIHGITTERAMADGLAREAGLAQIAFTVADLTGPNIPLVGHNVSYDLTLLDRELRRTGIGWLTTEPGSGYVQIHANGLPLGLPFPVIDTLVLDKAADRFRKGKRQLSFVAEHYGVPMDEGAAHGATADAIASLRIAIVIARICSLDPEEIWGFYGDRRDPRGLARHLGKIGSLSLPELHTMQIEWAAEQAEGLRDYFIKSGKTEEADSVDGRWPIQPLDETVEAVDTTLI
jgi:DNA polymerase-3 subunit epsilon